MTRPMRAERPFTWDDYLQLPDSPLRHEVLDGELVVSPAPTYRHQRVLARLFTALQRVIEAPGHGEVLFAPFDVRLSHTDVVQPDLVVMLPRERTRLNDKFLDGPPSLAVEVLSPGTTRRDRGLKKARYAQNGVPEYWIVDADDDVVDRFVLGADGYGEPTEHRDTIALAALPDVAIELRPVFAR